MVSKVVWRRFLAHVSKSGRQPTIYPIVGEGSLWLCYPLYLEGLVCSLIQWGTYYMVGMVTLWVRVARKHGGWHIFLCFDVFRSRIGEIFIIWSEKPAIQIPIPVASWVLQDMWIFLLWFSYIAWRGVRLFEPCFFSFPPLFLLLG